MDSEEVADDLPASLDAALPPPQENGAPQVLDGFTRADSGDLKAIAEQYALAMSLDDLVFCKDYFSSIKRDPSLAELRVLDTYWSDHCRHTSFTTEFENFFDSFQDASQEESSGLIRALDLYKEARREIYGEDPRKNGKPRLPTLMDLATIGAKVLKKRGLANDVDESPEINACTVKVTAQFAAPDSAVVDDEYFLLFKNETHNHPTEIEPFGGAATCLGGAIRDPLSGRAYVHQAMRVTGCADPRAKLSATIPGKLPQVKIAREAAAGYSSYGNQIGVATGDVAEFYHEGYAAKHLELGAVIAAAPCSSVRREEPVPGDLILLVGGATGRDGIGGATGSSKAHTGESVEKSGAEVQKGNPVEERKIQRLFRNPAVTRLIKRCNDFGAGGVSVAVGELAPSLDINLDAVPKKYAGLDGIELAISESQERMAVVVAPCDADAFIAAAAAENLSAVPIASVTDTGRVRMFYNGAAIVDLSRDFLSSNGAGRRVSFEKENKKGGAFPQAQPTADALTGAPPSAAAGKPSAATPHVKTILEDLECELSSLRSCSRRGLRERFDGSVGAGSVLFPYGGADQGTPECGMAALLPAPVFEGVAADHPAEFPAMFKKSLTASLMVYGFDPVAMSASPYEGAKGAVREALAKIACMGGDPWTARLSLQEYFERPDTQAAWKKPAEALLGALEAQLVLGVPAIGGKDSMSGTYTDETRGTRLTVPPTLAAFAATVAPAARIRSGALSGAAGSSLILLCQGSSRNEWEIFKANMNAVQRLGTLASAAYPVGAGGVAAALAVMAFGNMRGIRVNADMLAIRGSNQGAVVLEIPSEGSDAAIKILEEEGAAYRVLGETLCESVFRVTKDDQAHEIPLAVLRRAYESPLNEVYPAVSGAAKNVKTPPLASAPSLRKTKISSAQSAPLVILPVFPGTNCEWDMEKSFREAGARTRQIVFRNRAREDIAASISALADAIADAQIIALSGGYSAGDEPDGSGKFIANVFRSPRIADALAAFLERDSLMLGICNGFQALVKLGLVPYGKIIAAPSPDAPTLTFNTVGRLVSRMARTRVISASSPWLALEEEGAAHIVPVSHGEGRFVISDREGKQLFADGQVAFCYANADNQPAAEEPDNPNGSDFAIEGITSPDGRILGKMGHSERAGDFVHINIPGNKRQRIFEAGVRYFR